jgi:hypothetical protein
LEHHLVGKVCNFSPSRSSTARSRTAFGTSVAALQQGAAK